MARGKGGLQFLFDCDVLQRAGMPYYNQAETHGGSVGVGGQMVNLCWSTLYSVHNTPKLFTVQFTVLVLVDLK